MERKESEFVKSYTQKNVYVFDGVCSRIKHEAETTTKALKRQNIKAECVTHHLERLRQMDYSRKPLQTMMPHRSPKLDD